MHRALELLRSAPFAPPIPIALAAEQVERRHGVHLSKSRARCGFSRGHLLEIVVYVPGGHASPLEQTAAEELVALSLGEELFERWVGAVKATPTVRGGPLTVLNSNAEEQSAFPLAALPETVAAAIAGLQAGLSSEALTDPGGSEDWVLFELEPEVAEDYAAQDDLLFTSTRLPELKKTFLRGERVFSGRFAGPAALFTYLKYESAFGTGTERLAERAALEANLTRALSREQGALFGVGLGVRYVYLDFTLYDPSCVEATLMPALRDHGIGRRAWLLFYDSELEREWIGVDADSPAPFFG